MKKKKEPRGLDLFETRLLAGTLKGLAGHVADLADDAEFAASKECFLEIANRLLNIRQGIMESMNEMMPTIQGGDV